ncbi:hypothetical protein ACJX0J_005825, partial [Zea mays]
GLSAAIETSFSYKVQERIEVQKLDFGIRRFGLDIVACHNLNRNLLPHINLGLLEISRENFLVYYIVHGQRTDECVQSLKSVSLDSAFMRKLLLPQQAQHVFSMRLLCHPVNQGLAVKNQVVSNLRNRTFLTSKESIGGFLIGLVASHIMFTKRFDVQR